jgi:hypothetical protein
MSKQYKLVRISRDEYLALGHAGVWVSVASVEKSDHSYFCRLLSDTIRYPEVWEDTEGFPFLYTRVEVSDDDA